MKQLASLESLVADVRFALRHFARKPLMAATIVIVLALGIGVNSAMVSVIQAFTSRPAPGVPKHQSHMRVYGLQQAAKGGRWGLRDLSYREMNALAQRKEAFAAVAGYQQQDVIIDREDRAGARALLAEFVTPAYWNTLGVALAGPGFAAEEPGVADMAVVLSLTLAEDLFATRDKAIGQTILVNETPVRVAGVAPPRFEGAEADAGRPQLWLPVSALAAVARAPASWPNESRFIVFARLAAGVSPDQASTIARGVVARLQPDSATVAGVVRGAEVLPMQGPRPAIVGDARIASFVVLGVVGLLILLVACTNVSSLLVAAAVGRRHEIAVRLSLGASRRRVLRQLLTESAMLAVAGGTLGLLLFWWIITALGSRLDIDLAPDVGTLAFTFAIALATGILFGLSPALHATRTGVATALRESGAGVTRRSRLQGSFVVAQLVFSQPLLVLIALVLSRVVGEQTPSATVSDQVIVANFRPLDSTGAVSQRLEAVDTLAARLAAQRGIAAVVHESSGFALLDVTATPAAGDSSAAPDRLPVHVEGTAPGYFALLGVPIVLGRDLTFDDTTGTDYAIVLGSDMARELFGGASPIGRQLTSVTVRDGKRDSVSMRVVGVFDAEYATTRSAGRRVYTAKGAHWRRDVLLIRTTGPALSQVKTLHTFLRSAAPGLPVSRFETLTQVIDDDRRIALQVTSAAAGAGAVALGLASIGLFAVVALSLGQRRREIGIRIALGGRPLRVAGMFFVSGLRLCVIGLLIGLPVSIAAMRFLMSVEVIVMPELNTTAIGLAIAGVLLVVASAATWFPARRAATVNPTLALRAE